MEQEVERCWAVKIRRPSNRGVYLAANKTLSAPALYGTRQEAREAIEYWAPPVQGVNLCVRPRAVAVPVELRWPAPKKPKKRSK